MADERPWDALAAPRSPRTAQAKLSAITRRNWSAKDEDPNAEVIAEMKLNRSVNRRRTGAGPVDISFATGRPRDPMFYWKENNLPYDYHKPEDLRKMREWARLIYATHPIIGSAIDVYSKYPLTGMELVCKDQALTDFYTDLFFDQLNYEEYLIDIGREYWTVGEAWPLGSFNETLGVWDDDELMNPDHIEVIRSPFLKEPRFEMELPDTIRELIEKREPAWEFDALMRAYPEFKNFMNPEARMPVSNILLRQLKFKGDTFNPRGIPILARGFRVVMQEEMLNAAVDAIATRLYTPLILAKIGASASDLGTDTPWIPTDGDLMAFEEALDAALAGDFRVLTTHFAVDITSVFGRELMPRFGDDFDRMTDKQLQVFGLSRTMLTGAGQGETYAADAINRDLISQLLTTYQRTLEQFFRDRALVVAEAQEHYDYEERDGKRYPIMEEILEFDEETGEPRIVEQPKLLIPDLHFKAMTMKDEEAQRQFYEALRDKGVPISQKTRTINTPIELDEEIETSHQEQVDQAVEAQRVRWDTFKALDAEGLPIPDDLEADFRPKAVQAQEGKAEEQAVPTLGVSEPADTMALAPTPEDIAQNPELAGEAPPAAAAAGNGATVYRLPRNLIQERARPEESDEMRATMPKYQFRKVSKNEAGEETEEWIEMEAGQEWGDDEDQVFEAEGRNHLMSGPSHVGQRRYAGIKADVPLDEQLGHHDEAV